MGCIMLRAHHGTHLGFGGTGDGGDGSGRNALGMLLVKVRKEMTKEFPDEARKAAAAAAAAADSAETGNAGGSSRPAGGAGGSGAGAGGAGGAGAGASLPQRSAGRSRVEVSSSTAAMHQQIQQAPRMSAVLRAMLTSIPPVDVDEAFLAREAVISARRAAAAAVARAQVTKQQLTWQQIAGGLAERPMASVRAMRSKFKKLLRIVSSEVVGAEATSDELCVANSRVPMQLRCSRSRCVRGCAAAGACVWFCLVCGHAWWNRYASLAVAMPLLVDGSADALQRLRRQVGEYEDSASIREACGLARELQAWRDANAEAIGATPRSGIVGVAGGSSNNNDGHTTRRVGSEFPGDSSLLCADRPEFGDDINIAMGSLDMYTPQELQYEPPADDASSTASLAAPSAKSGTIASSSHSVRSGSDSGAPSSAGASVGDGRPVDERWLIARCEQFLAANPDCVFDVPSLSAEVLGVLKTRREGEVQEGLYNLLGVTGFEFMELLMANIAQLRRLNIKSVRASAAISTSQLMAAVAAHGQNQASQPTTVRVLSESDKQLAKLIRKVRVHGAGCAAGPACGVEHAHLVAACTWLFPPQEEKRRHRRGESKQPASSDPLVAVGFSEEYLATERSLGLRNSVPEGAVPGTVGFNTETGRLGLPKAPAGGAGGFMQRKALPVGTVTKTFKGYEQVHVPAPQKPPIDPARLVPITDLPDWAQLAFRVRVPLHAFPGACVHAWCGVAVAVVVVACCVCGSHHTGHQEAQPPAVGAVPRRVPHQRQLAGVRSHRRWQNQRRHAYRVP